MSRTKNRGVQQSFSPSLYDSGAQTQKRFAGLGAAPYSQCSQGSGER